MQTNVGVEINKDSVAQLIYTFDWSEWLNEGDTIATVEYAVKARLNDPIPIVMESQGVDNTSKLTYVELSGGQSNKSYIVSALITTANSLIDRRAFRVNVVDRSA